MKTFEQQDQDPSTRPGPATQYTATHDLSSRHWLSRRGVKLKSALDGIQEHIWNEGRSQRISFSMQFPTATICSSPSNHQIPSTTSPIRTIDKDNRIGKRASHIPPSDLFLLAIPTYHIWQPTPWTYNPSRSSSIREICLQLYTNDDVVPCPRHSRGSFHLWCFEGHIKAFQSKEISNTGSVQLRRSMRRVWRPVPEGQWWVIYSWWGFGLGITASSSGNSASYNPVMGNSCGWRVTKWGEQSLREVGKVSILSLSIGSTISLHVTSIRNNDRRREKAQWTWWQKHLPPQQQKTSYQTQ